MIESNPNWWVGFGVVLGSITLTVIGIVILYRAGGRAKQDEIIAQIEKQKAERLKAVIQDERQIRAETQALKNSTPTDWNDPHFRVRPQGEGGDPTGT